MKVSWTSGLIIFLVILEPQYRVISNSFAGSSEAKSHKILVASASDLRSVLETAIPLFVSAHPGVDVTAVYGSSGGFANQIKQGAPFDLFFSADRAYAQALVSEQKTLLDRSYPYATGRLVVWVKNASVLNVDRDGLKALRSPHIHKIAIANPDHAPYGRAAVDALKSTGIYEELKSKLVFGENISQAAQFAQSGAADAGILAVALALSPAMKAEGRYSLVPESVHQPLSQSAVIIKTTREPKLARDFLEFMTGAEGMEILSRFGFGKVHN